MEGYRTDEEQAEQLKKWWKENGLSIIGGIVIGLSAVLGWRAWQVHLVKQAEAASDIYQSVINHSRQAKLDLVRENAEKLIVEYKSTTYAIYAAFMLARLDAEGGDFEQAINHLKWIISNSNDEEYVLLAKLRHARILLMDDKTAEAMELLSGNPGKFLSSFEELKGDIYLQQGNIEAARNAYELALASSGIYTGDNSLLELKLDNIGRN